MKVTIKNIVCQRCVKAVRSIFESEGVSINDVSLVGVDVPELNQEQINILKEKLLLEGFEWLEEQQIQLVAKIKALIIQQIHYEQDALEVNFSDYLSQELHLSYAHLSRLFSAEEGRSIVSYIIAQKIEKIKNLLVHGDLPLSEIAYLMHYSSTGQLSNQFKDHVGVTPSVFRKEGVYKPTPLDKI